MTVHMRPYIKDDIELDQIAVHGIRVKGYHGVLDTEREGGQVFFADVVAHVNSRTAASRDDVAFTVNYSDMADRAAEVLAGSPGSPNHLIESVAEKIARTVLEMDGVECVDVTVHKPHAPLHVEFQDVTVTIRRDLSDGGLWADKRIGSSAGESDDPLDLGATPVRDVMDVRPLQPVGALIALGGNLEDVEATFRAALAELHRVNGVEVQSASPLVRTAPEGGVDQPDYLNAVVRVQTALAPRELLAACHGIEMLHGRDRSVPGSARTLDLDLISYDGVTGETPDLTLPHPRAHQRGFVLLPWSHMEPDAVLEPHGPVTELARQVGLDGVRMVSTQWPHVPAADALAGPSIASSAQSAVTSGTGLPALPPQSQSAEQPQSAEYPQSAEQSAAAGPSYEDQVPDRLSPYAPAAGSSPAPETSFAPQPDFDSQITAPPAGPASSEPAAPTQATQPAWAPVQQSAAGTSAPAGTSSAEGASGVGASAVSSTSAVSTTSTSTDQAAEPAAAPVAQEVPSFRASAAPDAASAPQPQFEPAPQPQFEPAPQAQPSAPQASASAQPPAHRPDTPESAPSPQPGVPRRTSFGVMRQQAESDESN